MVGDLAEASESSEKEESEPRDQAMDEVADVDGGEDTEMDHQVSNRDEQEISLDTEEVAVPGGTVGPGGSAGPGARRELASPKPRRTITPADTMAFNAVIEIIKMNDETKRLKLENARLQTRVANLEKDQAESGSGASSQRG